LKPYRKFSRSQAASGQPRGHAGGSADTCIPGDRGCHTGIGEPQILLGAALEVSKSGDAVTFTFDLSNSAGTNVPYTATFTVDNGIITSSTSSQT